MEFLSAIENSGLASWVRESPSIWSYPTIIFLHGVGMAFLVGMNTLIALRLLGFAPGLPVAPMGKFFPFMYLGFWINAGSGLLLFIADATTMAANPLFYLKMTLIALAVVNIQFLKKMVYADPLVDKVPVPMTGKVLAGLSLFLWAGAITAGRLTAYLGNASK
jgi:hypothetical protein